MTCLYCEEFSYIKITTPNDLNKIITVLKQETKNKKFILIEELESYDSFSTLDKDNWNDIVEHYFICATCQQPFCLIAETYHGSGGAFKALFALPEKR